MDKSLITLGINEQNTISHISDCILNQYHTNVCDDAHKTIDTVLSIIDSADVSAEVLGEVEEYRNNLMKTRLELSKDCVLFEKLLELNKTCRETLQSNITVLNDTLLSDSISQEDSYDVKALQRRVEDLMLTCTVSSQLESQLQVLSDGNRKTVSLIENTVFTTITLWKNKLFLEKQKSKL